MNDIKNQIMQLEEVLAHLSVSNEELSTELVHSNKRIEQLERKIAMLENRFASLEDNIDTPVPNEKPPHW